MPFSEEAEKRFTSLLCREIEMRKDRNIRLNTIYFGGGSPAVIPPGSIEKIVKTVSESFDTAKIREMTIEVNPEEGNSDRLILLGSMGFNRVSVGVQSFSDADLRYLSRNHTADQAVKCLESARSAGFDSVSADLIIGLPSQDECSVGKNIDILSDMGVDHVSAYLLEGVKSFGGRGRPDPDRQADIYNYFRERIGTAGYEQYEVSNFCRSGKYSMHNMNYWEGGSYIGAGLSASGYLDGSDYSNYTNIDTYENAIQKNVLPVAVAAVHNQASRDLFTGLRLARGVAKEKAAGYETKFSDLIGEGFIEETESYFRVKPSHLVILNDILAYLL
jgi:oxygen-independent coproporphyrinogen-3 oxidase